MGKSPATDRAAELTALIEKNADQRCVEFFADMPEAERRELAKVAVPICKQALKLVQTAGGGFTNDARLPSAQIAVLATASLSELCKLGWRAIPSPAAAAVEILSNRQSDWLDGFAQWLIGETAFSWPLVRRLVRQGLAAPPTHENYTLGMIVTIDGWGRGWFVQPPDKSVVANLRADRELLEREIWNLFRVEGQGELTLAAHDKYITQKGNEHNWAGALVTLSETGELPRGRLLDESLDALNRGFSQFRVAWFSQFHELLEPTVSERVERLDKYLTLLASPIPPTVTFALDALDRIDKERPLLADELLEPLAPALMARHKGTAVRAVQWLERLGQREEMLRGQIALKAAEALVHEAADVQKAALAAIEKFGSPADAKLRDAVAAAEKHVAASLRKRMATWLSTEGATSPQVDKSTRAPAASKMKKTAQPEADLGALEKEAGKLPAKWRKLAGVDALLASAKQGRAEITALDFGPLDVPRLDPAARIDPLADLDAWIDACAHYLENRDLVDEGERVLDGVSRLCGEQPAGFERRLGPLKKRADKLYRGLCLPFAGHGLWHDVIGVVRAWATGKVVLAVRKKNERGYPYWAVEDRDKPLYFANVTDPASLLLAERSLDVARRAAERIPRSLLSAPTHTGGWIDPLALVERLAAWQKQGDEPPVIEGVLALLRLAPDNRPAAIKRATKLSGELADVVRYALGAEQVKIGKTTPLWIAAARARNPLADDREIEKRFPGLGPDAGTAARYEWAYKIETHTYSGRTYSYQLLHVATSPPAPKKAGEDLLSVLLHHKSRETAEGNGVDDVRWSASWWPASREAHFAAGAKRLGNNLDWSSAYWANKTYLEPLLDPDTPLGEMGSLVLCLGLSAKEPGEHTLAADALAAAISDGRVDGNCLAPTLAKLLSTAGIKPGRWAKVLAGVARLSPLHLHVIRRTLEHTLAAAPGALNPPLKDIHHLLEILLELVAETGDSIGNQALRQLLSTVSSGKPGKAAKALLAAGDHAAAPPSAEVLRAAIEQRINRAKRWAQREATKPDHF